LKIKNLREFELDSIRNFKEKNKKTFDFLISLRKYYIEEAKLNQYLKKKK